VSYRIHQQQLWIKICQIVNSDPDRKWPPNALAEELGIPVGSGGYDRILEVLQEAQIAQDAAQQKIKIGFV